MNIVSKLREPMNGFTHSLGVLLAILALIFLLTRNQESLTGRHLVAFSIFGGAMFLLFLASTLYHWLPLAGKKLEIFRKIDHIMIFVYIAACYTPVCLITLQGSVGNRILIAVWFVVVVGTVLKLFWLNAPRILYTGIYLLMGWAVIIGIKPLTEAMSGGGLLWLSLGGFFYTVGAAIYAFKKPNPWPNVFGFHELFHVFVLFGSFSHFWMMYSHI